MNTRELERQKLFLGYFLQILNNEKLRTEAINQFEEKDELKNLPNDLTPEDRNMISALANLALKAAAKNKELFERPDQVDLTSEQIEEYNNIPNVINKINERIISSYLIAKKFKRENSEDIGAFLQKLLPSLIETIDKKIKTVTQNIINSQKLSFFYTWLEGDGPNDYFFLQENNDKQSFLKELEELKAHHTEGEFSSFKMLEKIKNADFKSLNPKEKEKLIRVYNDYLSDNYEDLVFSANIEPESIDNSSLEISEISEISENQDPLINYLTDRQSIIARNMRDHPEGGRFLNNLFEDHYKFIHLNESEITSKAHDMVYLDPSQQKAIIFDVNGNKKEEDISDLYADKKIDINSNTAKIKILQKFGISDYKLKDEGLEIINARYHHLTDKLTIDVLDNDNNFYLWLEEYNKQVNDDVNKIAPLFGSESDTAKIKQALLTVVGHPITTKISSLLMPINNGEGLTIENGGEKLITYMNMITSPDRYLDKGKKEIDEEKHTAEVSIKEDPLEINSTVKEPNVNPEGVVKKSSIDYQFKDSKEYTKSVATTALDLQKIALRTVSELNIYEIFYPGGDHPIPTATDYINHFNKLSEFVVHEILLQPNYQSAANVFGYWLNVADYSLNVATPKDLLTAAVINSAFSNGSILRLSLHEKLKGTDKKKLDDLAALVEPAKNSVNYRNFSKKNTNVIPLIAPYLGDMTFLIENAQYKPAWLTSAYTKMAEGLAINMKEIKKNYHSVAIPTSNIAKDIEQFEPNPDDNYKLSKKILPINKAPKYSIPSRFKQKYLTPQPVPFSSPQQSDTLIIIENEGESFTSPFALEYRIAILEKEENHLEAIKELEEVLTQGSKAHLEEDYPLVDEEKNKDFMLRIYSLLTYGEIRKFSGKNLTKALEKIKNLNIKTSYQEVLTKEKRKLLAKKTLEKYNVKNPQSGITLSNTILLKDYAYDIINNSAIHLTKDQNAIYEPPKRKAIAILHLLQKEPAYFECADTSDIKMIYIQKARIEMLDKLLNELKPYQKEYATFLTQLEKLVNERNKQFNEPKNYIFIKQNFDQRINEIKDYESKCKDLQPKSDISKAHMELAAEISGKLARITNETGSYLEKLQRQNLCIDTFLNEKSPMIHNHIDEIEKNEKSEDTSLVRMIKKIKEDNQNILDEYLNPEKKIFATQTEKTDAPPKPTQTEKADNLSKPTQTKKADAPPKQSKKEKEAYQKLILSCYENGKLNANKLASLKKENAGLNHYIANHPDSIPNRRDIGEYTDIDIKLFTQHFETVQNDPDAIQDEVKSFISPNLKNHNLKANLNESKEQDGLATMTPEEAIVAKTTIEQKQGSSLFAKHHHINVASVLHTMNNKTVVSDLYYDRKEVSKLGKGGYIIWAKAEIDRFWEKADHNSTMVIQGDLPKRLIERMILYCEVMKRDPNRQHEFRYRNQTNHYYKPKESEITEFKDRLEKHLKRRVVTELRQSLRTELK